MCGVVLEILNLYSDNSSRRRTVIIVVRILDGEEVGGEGGVEGVGEQHKLE